MSPIRKGKVAVPAAQNSVFQGIKAGEAIKFAPLVGLDELISVDLHEFWEVNPAVFVVCTGEHDCPGCLTKNKPRFKAYLPVRMSDSEIKVFPFGISIMRQLEELEEELGTLQGKVLKVKRTGSGMSTRYTVLSLGKKSKIKGLEIPDIEDLLGPFDNEGMAEKMNAHGVIVPGVKVVKSTPATEDDSEEDGDFENDSEEDDDDWGDI